MCILLLGTLETKREEAAYLMAKLRATGLEVRLCDISLHAGGAQWCPEEKLAGMNAAAARALDEIMSQPAGHVRLVLAIGGGTGGQIALRVLQGLPSALPKVLLTTLPFDPRFFVADSSIVLVPTIADLCGLNDTVRAALDTAAAVADGMYRAGPSAHAVPRASVGVTSLGVTAQGTDALCARLRLAGEEVTVFHSNGFGGAAFARWAAEGAFKATVDYTPHELTRCTIAGVHADMPTRFTAMGHVPRVLLTGGVNIVGLGAPAEIPEIYRARAHYSHSPLFTHVKCTPKEAAQCADVLGRALATATAPVRVFAPMGGFSSEDRPGGAVHDPDLRQIFADALERHIPVTRLPGHINDAQVAHTAADALTALLKEVTDA
jgi:uncharacterized protein (UPF0261 family)